MPKVVFWDWTGTLADESALDKAVCRTMEEMCAKNNGISTEEAVQRFNRILKNLEGTWGWHDYTEHGRKLGCDWKEALQINLEKLIILPHAEEILDYSKKQGYLNCLVTNAVRDVISMRLKHSGLEKYFDLILASDDVKSIKSEGKHFALGIERLKADVGSSYSIGDNPVQDLIPAKKLGIKTVFCAYWKGKTHYHSEHISKQHSHDAKADYVIQNLMELKGILI
ncbi:MAG: HAD hydrolase-like protein [Candidatus Aenigmatarchaeota archaeon]